MDSSEVTRIIDVWKDNFDHEMNRVGFYISEYPIITIDTEFPGFIYRRERRVLGFPPELDETERMYKNVKRTKLIQFGIALCDDSGNKPPAGGTWQFNFHFDLDNDEHDKKHHRYNTGIDICESAGICFKKLKEDGINHNLFFSKFKEIGLLGNKNIQWICWYGLYDFGYMLNHLGLLPEEPCYFRAINIKKYFPKLIDLKMLNRVCLLFYHHRGNVDLNRMAYNLEIIRWGHEHQAGSDAALTRDIFIKEHSKVSIPGKRDVNGILWNSYNVDVSPDQDQSIIDNINLRKALDSI